MHRIKRINLKIISSFVSPKGKMVNNKRRFNLVKNQFYKKFKDCRLTSIGYVIFRTHIHYPPWPHKIDRKFPRLFYKSFIVLNALLTSFFAQPLFLILRKCFTIKSPRPIVYNKRDASFYLKRVFIFN